MDMPIIEMFRGKILKMSPRPIPNHNRIKNSIGKVFERYLEGKSCEYFDDVDVYLCEMNHFAPDIAIVCNPDIIKDNAIYGAPDLAVEILSPSTTKRDRIYKREIYGEYGIKEYWIVDPKNFSVEIYLLKDGKLELNEVFTIIPKETIRRMTDEEKTEIIYTFKTSLFDDLEFELLDIFARVMPEDY